MKGIRFLNQNGAKAICIPCNSAHCWFDEMQAASVVPLLHIVRASADQVRKKNPTAKAVGVLSTFGTHTMGIYTSTLKDMGYTVISPTTHEFESFVSPAIAMIKANNWADAKVTFAEAAQHLVEHSAEVIVLGCTEIPFGMEGQCRANPSKFVDSNDALVDVVIEFFGQRRPNLY